MMNLHTHTHRFYHPHLNEEHQLKSSNIYPPPPFIFIGIKMLMNKKKSNINKEILLKKKLTI